MLLTKAESSKFWSSEYQEMLAFHYINLSLKCAENLINTEILRHERLRKPLT